MQRKSGYGSLSLPAFFLAGLLAACSGGGGGGGGGSDKDDPDADASAIEAASAACKTTGAVSGEVTSEFSWASADGCTADLWSDDDAANDLSLKLGTNAETRLTVIIHDPVPPGAERVTEVYLTHTDGRSWMTMDGCQTTDYVIADVSEHIHTVAGKVTCAKALEPHYQTGSKTPVALESLVTSGTAYYKF